MKRKRESFDDDKPHTGARASLEDADGNRWLLQEIKERLPGREWKRA